MGFESRQAACVCSLGLRLGSEMIKLPAIIPSKDRSVFFIVLFVEDIHLLRAVQNLCSHRYLFTLLSQPHLQPLLNTHCPMCLLVLQCTFHIWSPRLVPLHTHTHSACPVACPSCSYKHSPTHLTPHHKSVLKKNPEGEKKISYSDKEKIWGNLNK